MKSPCVTRLYSSSKGRLGVSTLPGGASCRSLHYGPPNSAPVGIPRVSRLQAGDGPSVTTTALSRVARLHLQRRWMPTSVQRAYAAGVDVSKQRDVEEDWQERHLSSLALFSSHSTALPPSSTRGDDGGEDATTKLVSQLRLLARESRKSRFDGAAENHVGIQQPSEVASVGYTGDDAGCHGGWVIHQGGAIDAHSVPAWQRGLHLFQASSTNIDRRVALEHLLFLCLQSWTRTDRNNFAAVTAAPMEVCEGVYRAWRQQCCSRPLKNNDAHESLVAGHRAIRSPFATKGVHHLYATALLREFHCKKAALRVPAVTLATLSRAGNTVQDAAGEKGGERKRSVRLHQILYLLNHAMEVLLLHHPQDTAIAAMERVASKTGSQDKDTAASGAFRRPPASSHSHRAPREVLRPSTALLVLEATREAAQLRRKGLARVHAATEAQAHTFPLLAALYARETDGDSPSSSFKALAGDGSVLSAVAREAFGSILRGTLAVHASPKRVGPPPLPVPLVEVRDDALLLYLGFLAEMQPAQESAAFSHEHLEEWDAVIQNASPTVRRLCADLSCVADGTATLPSGTQLISGSVSSSPGAAAAAAAAVEVFLNSYFSFHLFRNGVYSDLDLPAHRQVREAIVTTLCQTTPLPTAAGATSVTAVETCSRPPVARTHFQETLASERPAHASATDLPWCVWMLQLLTARRGHPSHVINRTEMASSPAGMRVESSDQASDKLGPTVAFSVPLITELRRREKISMAQPRGCVSPSKRVHRILQLMWVNLLNAAVQGQFSPNATSSLSEGSKAAKNFSSKHPSVSRSNGAPAVLRELFYPYYDKSQWRKPSVNLYLRLLHQWGQGEQVRQVFATVARREKKSRHALQRLVAGEGLLPRCSNEQEGVERAGTSTQHAMEGDTEKDVEVEREASGVQQHVTPATRPCYTAVTSRFPRHHPALTLESCRITLRHCGVSAVALDALWDISSDTHTKGRIGAETETNLDYISDARGDPSSISFAATSAGHGDAAAEARLAEEVLQYMICILHAAVHDRDQEAAVDERSDATADDGHAASTMNGPDTQAGGHFSSVDGTHTVVEGLPAARWARWIRQWCVPAVEELHERAGLEAEWQQLGY